MPFHYPNAAASVRPRRLRDKDKDIRYRSSSTSSRRSKDPASLADGRPLSQQPQTTQQSPHAAENATLDQLPPLPLSRTTSPCSATSPVLQAGQTALKNCEPGPQPYHIHTPASLQPYLEDDTESNHCCDSLLAESQHDRQPYRHSTNDPLRNSNPQPDISKADTPEGFSQPMSVNDVVASTLTSENQRTDLHLLSTPSPGAPRASQAPSDGGYYIESNRIGHRAPTFNAYSSEDFHFHSAQFEDFISDQQANTAQMIPYFAGYGYPTIMPHEPSHSFRTMADSNAKVFGRGPDDGVSVNHVREDDAAGLIYRIQSSMPDIYILVDRYRETLGQLAFQENMTRHAEAQKTEAVRQKMIYIDHLAKEMESAAQKHSTETSKFRLEIRNLEEKLKEVQDNLAASMNSRIELEKEFENQMSRIQKEHALKDQALRADIDAMNGAEAVVQNELVAIRGKHTEELDTVRNRWFRERTDLEASHARERRSLETVIETCQNKLENTLQKAQDEREKWSDERKAIQRDWNEQHQNLLGQHRKEIEELRKASRSLYGSDQNRLEDKVTRLQRQVETLKSGWDADKAKLAKAQSEQSAETSKLRSENERLQKMVDTFGEATDLKSRGNTYL